MQVSLRELVKPHVTHVVDDSLNGRHLGDDDNAIVRDDWDFNYSSRLVGWNTVDGPAIVAVHSHLDVELTNAEAEQLATGYLLELRFFRNDKPRRASFIV